MTKVESDAAKFAKLYRVRGDFVLVKNYDAKLIGGVEMPDIVGEAKRVYIMVVGDKVTDLKPGMRVLAIGTPGQDVVQLPVGHDRDLRFTKEANIITEVKEGKE